MKHRIVDNMPHVNEESPKSVEENEMSRMLLKVEEENLELRSMLREALTELRDAWKEIENLKNQPRQ